MDDNIELINEFLMESFETLDRVDQELIKLEQDPNNKEILNAIFRGIHTIKGTCGFLSYTKLEAVTHVGESLLDSLRAGRIPLDQTVATSLLQMIDVVRSMLTSIEQTQSEGEESHSELIATLKELNTGKREPSKVSEHSIPSTTDAPRQLHVIATEAPNTTDEISSAETAVIHEEIPTLEAPLDPFEAEFMAALNQYQEAQQSEPVNASDNQELVSMADEPRVFEETLPEVHRETLPRPEIPGPVTSTAEVSVKSINPVKVTGAELGHTAVPSAAKNDTEREKKSVLAESALRVDVGILDSLMNLVGELVLARNQILQHTKFMSDPALLGAANRLNIITSELQEGVMRTRMQPISTVWSKFPRIVRDLSCQIGKEVRLEMEGKETELDKTIIEAIKDPLTHIVRNSVDHGIENPEERLQKGKDPEGTLLLRAFHEGGHVIIEMIDNGAGLNTEKIKAKAIENGLYTAERLDRMSEQEIHRLIFAAGFSTADKVTNISGRGVGMDVVRSNIEKIGGQVDIFSVRGAGSTIKIKIPLTLAIVPALIISTGGQRFAIPQVNLVELVLVQGDSLKTELERIGDATFLKLRGNLLPILYLNTQLNLRKENTNEDRGEEKLNIVVVRADDREFGIVVDIVHDTEEIVVKPLARQIKEIDVVSGATIMGDGQVALILDTPGLARHAKVVRDGTEDSKLLSQRVASESSEKGVAQTLLIVELEPNRRSAIPLNLVNRLEEFSPSQIEFTGRLPVVQYRDGIMPLVGLTQPLLAAERADDLYPVIVYQSGESNVGLVVRRILDIVEESYALDQTQKRAGVLGSTILQSKVTELLDLPTFVQNSLHQGASNATETLSMIQ